MKRAAVLALVAYAVVLCPAAPRADPPKEVAVYAASSLRDVFERLAITFEKRHPNVKVLLASAGSQELRLQIEQGAPADVFASADERQMATLRRQALVGASVVFARNEPVLVAPALNPAELVSFTDLTKAEHIVLGVREVPIGAYAEQILAAAAKLYGNPFREQVAAHVRSRELNVRQVLTKVILGEADAGIVYRTDALTAKGRVVTIEIPRAINVTARYPIAVLRSAPHPAWAAAWVEWVRGAEGRASLAAAGFR